MVEDETTFKLDKHEQPPQSDMNMNQWQRGLSDNLPTAFLIIPF